MSPIRAFERSIQPHRAWVRRSRVVAPLDHDTPNEGHTPMSATDATFRETLLKQSIAHFQSQIDRLTALTTHDDETKAAISLYGEIVTVIAELRTKPAVVVPELEHDAMMRARFGHEVTPNGRLERRIVAALCAHMAQHGWLPATLIDSDNVRTKVHDTKSMMELLFNLDEAWVVFSKGSNDKHAVRFILGNGEHIVSDWGYTEGDPDGFDATINAFDSERFA